MIATVKQVEAAAYAIASVTWDEVVHAGHPRAQEAVDTFGMVAIQVMAVMGAVDQQRQVEHIDRLRQAARGGP